MFETKRGAVIIGREEGGEEGGAAIGADAAYGGPWAQ